MDNQKKIMVVDDNEHIRLLLKSLLESNGYEVILAEDGLEGMEKLRNETMDLILLDIRLPYVSGIGLIKIAKEHKPGIPIICMTGYGASPETIAQEECVEMVFSKPFSNQELLEAIRKLLGSG